MICEVLLRAMHNGREADVGAGIYSFFGFLSMSGALVMMLSPKRFFSASIAP